MSRETPVGRTGTTRRRALLVTGAVAGAAAAGVLSGCSGERSEPGARSSAQGAGAAPEGAEATDAAVRKRLAAASGALRDQYDAVIAAHPTLAARLTALRTSVAAHASALGGTARAAGSRPVAVEPAAALKELAAAERRTSDALTAAIGGARPELARLLASVAAAGAAHAYLLTAPAAGGAR
ncbi:hypothetical protein ACH4E8_00215 [Streptomyces sp. NPDC017979]|uniref:hypothetical protein n=1 Tax=Streptomyces sp. NPDC017979 TaxID=3365024 RepID=UPI003795AD2C